jgi:hypothetical protein
MAYNVDGLVNYVKQENLPLLSSSMFSARTADLMQIQTGVKSAAALNIMETAVVLQADSCAFNASGNTTFTQRNLTVAPIKIQQTFCPKDLEKKWTQSSVKAGSKQDALPFEAEFSNVLAGKIAETLETAIWKGDTLSGTANLNRFDGFIKLIDAAAGVIDGNTGSATSITVANVLAIVDAIYTAIPTKLLDKDDVKIFMGYDTFRFYTTALKNANLFHYEANATEFRIFVPGTAVEIIAVAGLNSSNRIFAMRLSNMFLGVDLEGEEDNFDMWYSQDNRDVRLSVEFKYGVQFAFPDEIVEYTNSL